MRPLTEREKDVLHLVAQGLSCRAMAGRLGIAEYTVRKHRANLCRKLDCHSAARLVALAVQTEASGQPVSSSMLSAFGWLRPREREVLRLLAQGLTSKEVARALGNVSPRTVHKHRERIMRCLGVHDMAALMRAAKQLDALRQEPQQETRPSA